MGAADTILTKLPLLQLLPPEVKKVVMDSFEEAHVPFGTPIVIEGEEADAFYVLRSGRARVVKRGDNGHEISLTTLRPGETFGEMSLLEQSLSKATVRASSDVDLYKLDRSVFLALLRSHPDIRKFFELQIKHRSLHNFFRMYSPFAKLPPEALRIMLSEMESVSIPAGQFVIRQGDPPGPMFLIEEGHLRVFSEDNGTRNYRAYLRRGDFFGEMSVFKSINRTASVESVSPCRLLKLTESTFSKLVNGYSEFKSQIEDRINQYDYKQIARVPLDFAEEILPAEAAAQASAHTPDVDQEVKEEGEAKEEVEAAATEEAPFASEDGFFLKKGKRIRRFPHVTQIDQMDCGAACLAMVCRYFGRSVSLARIRQLVHVSIEGTSLRALVVAAQELGLASRSVKASKRNVTVMPLPAIIHWEGNHWVVLYDVDAKHARIADPATGNRQVSRKDLDEKWSGYTALFDYTKDFEKAPEGQSRINWLIPFFRPFLGIFGRAMALAFIVSALSMVLPVITQVVVDRVLVEQDVGLLNVLVIAMMAVLVFMILAMILQRYLLSFTAVRIDAGSLDYLTRRLLNLPMTYFQTRRTGDIQRRLNGIRQVRQFLAQQGVSALTAFVQLLTAFGLMIAYSPLLAMVFLATAPLYGLLMYFSSRLLRPLFDETEEAFGRYSSFQIDAIKGIETVKSLAAENRFREVMLSQFHRVARRMFKTDFTTMCYEGAIQMVTFLSIVLFLWVGAKQVMDGKLTIGALVAFNALVAMANAPIATLLLMWDNLQAADILLNRLNDVFEQEPEQGTDRSRLHPVRTLEGRIRFQNVGFRYGGPDTANILEGITFDVPAGKMIAVVGRSGSGKTTLIKCLAGLLEPTDGTIFYDGVDLKTLNYRDLRRQVGYVLQENYLFDDTIARNIGFGDSEPDMDRVIWAARAACAQEFIERLPLGYETKVGESGISLSGGQRQRVAIARALYQRPPVLIFDEATSSLDTESERAVKESIDELLQGRTSFVIAHRLSTIRDADFIVVLEKGRLVEIGNHDELMKRQGLYFYLVSQQLGL
jgi:ATP-binding cassette subfamily B protein